MQYVVSHPEFSYYEKMMCRYAGSALMYVISKRMKSKDGIVDERLSVYQAIGHWLSEIGTERKFLGGDVPCRVGLEVFGYLRAVHDMDTFSDALKNTKLNGWYRAMEGEM